VNVKLHITDPSAIAMHGKIKEIECQSKDVIPRPDPTTTRPYVKPQFSNYESAQDRFLYSLPAGQAVILF